MQANETQNRIMHFGRGTDGKLKLTESVPTGGASSVILALATNFGYGTVSACRLADGRLNLLRDPANEAIPGDGTFRAVSGLVGSGSSDSWLTPDDRYFQQIFGNASVV